MKDTNAKIMGILNITPDSFSDGGIYNSDYENRIAELIDAGANIIDIGGESTGPNSSEVKLEEELKRVKPVIDFIAKNDLIKKVDFSIDTYKSEVARYALKNGFKYVNDVTALRGDSSMIDVLLEYEPYIILLYSKDKTPRTSLENIEYDDVMASIKTFFINQIVDLVEAGFPEDKIIVDPGMGMFISSNPKYSYEIIDRLLELKQLTYPICICVSRKSFLGGNVNNRDEKSVELSLKAIENGANIIRIHNVELLKDYQENDNID